MILQWFRSLDKSEFFSSSTNPARDISDLHSLEFFIGKSNSSLIFTLRQHVLYMLEHP
jgi:hypothetical protein